MIKVILRFGNGNLKNGCEHIDVEIRDDDNNLIAQDSGSLPSSVQLWELYKSWKSSFRSRFGGRIVIPKKAGSSFSQKQIELSECINQFPREFNRWLLTEGFRPIEKLLNNHLDIDASVNFTVEAEDNQLRRLPWYLWEFFEDHPYVEPALAFTKYESGRIGESERDNIRILVVIGDSQGIDTEIDKKVFEESLGDAQVKILSQPSPHELDESLWDERGWDILAFLGHSESSEDGKTASIKINETDSLSLVDLKNALKSAIKKGLKLAIFNSCDGLGLVGDLRDLYLPHTIVMREPIPDKIAQEFIKNFLPTFKAGKYLPIAVREAREKLQKWEQIYPCATWLPILCQNPGVESINWLNLGGKPDCPYRGLFAFGEEDADIFFGREVVSEELYQRIQKRESLIAVVGASGSGKSSVVFAGLVPQLRNTGVKIVDFRPGRNPFESLAVTLAPLWYEANHPGCKFEDLEAYNRRTQELDLLITNLKDKRGLCEVVEQIVASSKHHLVIIADQFEELYTLSAQCQQNSKEDTCQLFLDSLLNAVNDSPAFTLVLTLRADFFHHAIKDCKFADILQNKNYLLRPMNREELQRAISFPAEKKGVKLERGLLETLLDDVGNKAENLPLLEFALTQLWKKQEHGLLKTVAYREIGSLQQCLAKHAEDIYTQLNKEQRQIMKRVFVQLVRPGEGVADTRNVVVKSDFQHQDWDLITILNQENARLLVINYEQDKQETVEIVHEALINGWGRLTNWMGYHRQFRTWQERLKVSIKNWEEKQYDDGYLLTAGALDEAEMWLNSVEHSEYLSDAQRSFIQLSSEAKNRKIKEDKRKHKQTVTRLSFALISALFATSLAGLNWAESGIKETKENLNNSLLTSENFLNLEKYGDALFAAIKAHELLNSSLWKNWIPNHIKQKINIAIHQPTNSWSSKVKYTLEGHKSDILDVEFSPDGKTIASASKDNKVKIWSAKNGTLLHTLEGHKSDILNVGFSSDSKNIFSVSRGNIVKVWSTKNGHLLNTLKDHKSPILSVDFSPDGKKIASGFRDGKIKIWSAENGKLINTIVGHKSNILAVVFSLDSKIIASGFKDGKIKLWSAVNGNLIHTLEGHKSDVLNLDFSPDGTKIASASRDNTVKIWSTSNSKLLRTIRTHKFDALSVEFSPDGQTIASSSKDDAVKLWSVENGDLLHTITGHKSDVLSIDFSPDSQTIASASSDNTVKLWSAKNDNLLNTLHGHKSDILNVEFSSDGTKIASASEDSTVKLWSAVNGNLLHTLEAHKSGILSIDFSPDSKTITSASRDNTVKLWSVVNGNLLYTLKGHKSDVLNVNFSPDGKTIASASRDNTVKLWSAINGNLLHTLKAHKSHVVNLAFSPDGKTIASASSDNTVKLWSAVNGNLLHTLEGHKSNVLSVEFSPDGKTIASASRDNTVKLWSAVNGDLLHTLEGHKLYVVSVKFSPDSKTIASPSWDNTVKLWSTENGNLLHTLEGHKFDAWRVDFSPDSKIIASASRDSTVKLWSVNYGKLLHTLKGHKSHVLSVKFSPDGKKIASASRDNTVKLWNWNFDNLLKRGCNKLEGYLINKPEKLEEIKPCQNAKIFAAAAFTLVEKGDFEAAVKKFKQARQFNVNIDLNPKTEKLDNNPQAEAAIAFIFQGKELVRNGQVKEAIVAYNEAPKFNPELQIPAKDWNTLCWNGSLYNHAKDIIFACEKAVALEPKNGYFHGSRGVARALTGDTQGAIKDFEVFTDKISPYWKSQRQSWIKYLQNGKNPFTEEKLKKLRERK